MFNQLSKTLKLSNYLFILDFSLQGHKVIMSLSKVFHVTRHTVIGRQFSFKFVDYNGNLFKSSQSYFNSLQSFNIERWKTPDSIPLFQDFVQLGLVCRSLVRDLSKEIFDLVNLRFMALNIGFEIFMSINQISKGIDVSWKWSFANL